MVAPRYPVDFYSDAFIRDPVPHYAQMHAMGPVVWFEQNRCYAATTHATVSEVLRDADRFRSGRGLSLNDEVNALLIGSSLNSDSPEHERRRSITAAPISRAAIRPLDVYIEKTAAQLADRLVARQTFDAVGDFAAVLPLAIVVDLVGLSDEGKGEMLNWASAAFNLFEGFNARSRASMDDLKGLQAYLGQYGRREALKEGGLARRIFDVAPERGFTQEEAAQLMRDYINPSIDTTISAAGFAAYLFATCPDQWDLLRADPGLIPNAVEEIIRLATPIRAFSRYVAEDTEVAGVPMAAGARVMAVYASANRDPGVWADPDRFDVTRRVKAHLGFGHCRHMCMGLHLARRELIHLIGAMAARVKHWHLEGEPEVAMNNTIRAFARLPMRVARG
ncbi:MAG: cytochrome P450 [Pseudomonadota bacterium]